MMTQSVMTQAMNLFGNANASVNSRSSKSGTGFEQLMDHNLRPDQDAVERSKESPPVAQNKRVETKTDASKQKVNTEGTEKDNYDQKWKTKGSQTDGTKASAEEAKNLSVEEQVTKDSKTSISEEDNLTPMQELIAQITGMLQKLQEVVMQTLGLNQEEFNQLLNQYQEAYGEITTSDLLETDVLRQLVLLNSGTTDPCAFLTDEKLEQTMKQLLQTLEQIGTEAELELTPQELKDLLMQSRDSEKAITEEPMIRPAEGILPSTGKEAEGKKDNNLSDVAEATRGSLHGEEESTIEITIANDSNSGSPTDARDEETTNQDFQSQFQAFVDKLVQKGQSTQIDMTGNEVRITELREIANQIIEQIKVVIKPEQTSMELMLNPEHLGKVNLSIQAKDGAMTAHFVVQNELSKEAIESQMQTLRDTLNQQGIKVESVEVTVAAYAFEQNTQQEHENHSEERKSQSGRRITLEEAFTMSEIPEEEGRNNSDGLRGSQIDYTA